MAIFYPSLVEIRSDMMEHHTEGNWRFWKNFENFQMIFKFTFNLTSTLRTPMQLFFTRQVER